MSKQMLAIALCRVSSLEQLESNSLNHQRDNVLKAAEQLGVSIPADGIWSGHVSSKRGVNYNRKDLKEMLEYCKKHPNVKYLIVQEVDRFMRSPDEQTYFQVKFKNEVGVQIWYADKPELNKDDIYARLMCYMEGFRAAGSNDERQRKSINGHLSAINEGRYTFHPKPGYRKGSESGVHDVDAVRGPILQSILSKIASRLITPSEGLKSLNHSEFIKGRSQFKMDKFRKILTDPYYAGIVEIDKQVKMRNENGRHVPLISIAQHKELIKIMDKKIKNQTGPMKGGNPKYPLSNLLHCDKCRNERYGRFVGFDSNNGRDKTKIYEKYRCRSCGKYQNRETLHHNVVNIFNEVSISKKDREKLIKALDKVWKQRELQSEQDEKRIQSQIKNLERLVSNHIEAITDPSNQSIKDEIIASINKYKDEIKNLERQLDKLTSDISTKKADFINFSFDFVDNMGSKFFEISKENRLRCKQIVFPSGFRVDEKNKVYTTEISPIYR